MNLIEYMNGCRDAALAEITRLVPSDARLREPLYDLVLDYPLRPAKGIRPALCVATCRALGGRLESVLPSAATLELYHNAFLVHDDVEDGSDMRRDRATLHRDHGVPIAINVGDAMLAMSLQPLLDNMAVVGLGKALRVLQTVARMAQETAEGQAIELAWIRSNDWAHGDRDYVRMVYKKTAWYTFVAPIRIGAIVAGASSAQLAQLSRFATLLGVAFQIQDDLLNLEGEETAYGKEIAGDLWEGKHTLILTHALRVASPEERSHALAILAKPRPPADKHHVAEQVRSELARLGVDGLLGEVARSRLLAVLDAASEMYKTEADIRQLLEFVYSRGSLVYARAQARRRAQQAARVLQQCSVWVPGSIHRDFIEGLVDFVIERTS
jgi:geranylgeranyl diphosphate synthase type II